MIIYVFISVYFCLCAYLVTCLFVLAGGGVEPESHYPQWKRVHQNIERFPALNDSIAKLAEGTEFKSLSFCISITHKNEKNFVLLMEYYGLKGLVLQH